MDNSLTLDQKLALSKEHDLSMQKIRNMTEKENLRKFMKYERLNIYTNMVHEQQKVDSMIKEIDPKRKADSTLDQTGFSTSQDATKKK